MGGPGVEECPHLRRRGCRVNEYRLHPLRCTATEGGERPSPRYAVDRESARLLKVTQRARGPGVEVAADRNELAAAGEKELQRGNVPANLAAVHRSLSEKRSSERAECASRRSPRVAVDRKSDAPLEALDAATSRGAGDPVDRAGVDAVSAERHLQPGHLRIDAGRGSGCEPGGGCDECEQAKQKP